MRWYNRVAIGAKITINRTAHPSEYNIAFCNGHDVGSGVPAGKFPNRIRTAWVNVDTGFHSAMGLSIPGKLSDGTNVFAINVSGKSTMKVALLTTSGEGTSSPRHAITHENEYEKKSNKAYATTASRNDPRMRQPTAKPANDMMMIDNKL